MKPAKGLLVALVMLVLQVAFLPATSAEMDSLKVIITAEDKIYELDDTIEMEVSVYDKGELVDADEITMSLSTRHHQPNIDVSLSWVSTGVYQGSYQIQEEDQHAWFYAYAEKGSDGDGAELNIDIFHDDFELDIHFTHQDTAFAWPGDNITATITSCYRDDLVDVDYFEYLKFVDPFEEETEMNYTEISQGVYEVTCAIPNVDESGTYMLEAYATYANSHAVARAYIIVNVMTVWYRLESVAGSTATFTLGVADSNGKGVPNAEITITWPHQLTGTTNEEGTVILSLTDAYNGIHVMGEVVANEKRQSFEGSIYISDPDETPDPTYHYFDVIYEGTDYLYESGSSISRSYKAYNNSIPVQYADIYYYITMEGMDVVIEGCNVDAAEGDHIDGATQIIETGIVTTDQLGSFDLTFSAPSAQGQLVINFESGITKNSHNYNVHEQPHYDQDDNLVYEEDYDNMFISKGDLWEAESITIESDSLVIGGKTKITIKTDKTLDEGDELFAKWIAGSSTSGLYADGYESEWVCWVDGGNMIFLEKKGNNREYKGETVIPDFMSKDGDYTIMAGYTDGETGYPDFDHVTLKEGESAKSENPEALMPLILASLIVALIVILFAGFAMRKMSSSSGSSLPSEESLPPEDPYLPPEQPPSQPPDFTQPVSEPPSSHQSDLLTFPDDPPLTHLRADEQFSKPEDTEGGTGRQRA